MYFQPMNTAETNRINNLFIKLEAASKAANHFNLRCITDAENLSYHTVFEETLLEITIIQKQIIRALLKAGEVGELFSHVEAGTFQPLAIHAAFGRRAA
jgi:hypothetical protein